MNKTASIIIICALVITIGIIILGGSKNSSTNVADIQNSQIKDDGIQYVTIEAKAGYFPRVSTAKAGIPTKLIVKTNGTYDCSSALVIRSIGYQKMLNRVGEEIIDIGTPVVGVPLQGTCSMGMYNFTINFN